MNITRFGVSAAQSGVVSLALRSQNPRARRGRKPVVMPIALRVEQPKIGGCSRQSAAVASKILSQAINCKRTIIQ